MINNKKRKNITKHVRDTVHKNLKQVHEERISLTLNPLDEIKYEANAYQS